MKIWHKPLNLEKINNFCKNTAIEHLEIKITDYTDNEIIGTMPVDHRTHQPFGLLHGGASCLLAETLGSIASNLVIDTSSAYCVGLEINANHVRPVKSGLVTGVAKSVHLGKSTHIWEVKILNNEDKLVCISRLTMAIIKK